MEILSDEDYLELIFLPKTHPKQIEFRRSMAYTWRKLRKHNIKIARLVYHASVIANRELVDNLLKAIYESGTYEN